MPNSRNGSVDVLENEAAEIAQKRLRADADRSEIVGRARVGHFHFGEPFLQSPPRAKPRRAVVHVGVDDRQLFHVEVIEVEHRRELQSPIDRLERRIAVEQIERQNEIVRREELVRIAEEIVLVRMERAFKRRRRRRHLPAFEQVDARRP